MRSTLGQHLLRLLGVLCAVAGFLAWIGLAWKAFSDIDGVTPESDEGGRLMIWAVTGTVLMILGMVLLHLAPDEAEPGAPEERTPPS